MEVLAPDGRRWVVQRRWLPRYDGRGLRARWANRPRRGAKDDADVRWYDWLDLGIVDGPAWLVIAFVAAILLFALIAFGIPLLLAVVDLVLVLLVLVAGVVGRVVFRRPWTIEATSGGERRTRRVVGWFASGRAAAEWADELRHGRGQ